VFFTPTKQTLQDFIVLPTKLFRRFVIHSSLVILLPMKSPMETFRRLSFRQKYLISSLHQSVKKKTIADGFIDGNCAPKKKISPLKYTDEFILSVNV
jgi:hypothetical protein